METYHFNGMGKPTTFDGICEEEWARRIVNDEIETRSLWTMEDVTEKMLTSHEYEQISYWYKGQNGTLCLNLGLEHGGSVLFQIVRYALRNV